MMEEQTFTLQAIGIIHTPFEDREVVPIQSARSTVEGQVEVYVPFAAGLADVEGFSHIYLLYVFDRADPPALTVRPFLDDTKRGLFATRHPSRPNPVGLSVVAVIRLEEAVLHVRGVDMLNRTPLLDIKPYTPKFDHHDVTRTGWLQGQEEDRPWLPNYDS